MSIGTKIDLMSNGLKEKAQNEGWWDSKTTFNWTEGSLISESFSLWLKFPKKVPNHYPEYYPSKKQCLGVCFGTFCLDLN